MNHQVKVESTENALKSTYFRFKIKCLSCSLHFMVCSWYEHRHTADSLHCPECGQHNGLFMVAVEIVAGTIDQDVPGAASRMI